MITQPIFLDFFTAFPPSVLTNRLLNNLPATRPFFKKTLHLASMHLPPASCSTDRQGSKFEKAWKPLVRFPNCIVYYQSRGWGTWLETIQKWSWDWTEDLAKNRAGFVKNSTGFLAIIQLVFATANLDWTRFLRHTLQRYVSANTKIPKKHKHNVYTVFLHEN